MYAINSPIMFADHIGRIIVKPETTVSYNSLPENPTCTGEYAKTVCNPKFQFNNDTKTWDFVCVTEFRFNPKIEAVNNNFPGFQEFLTVHEAEHRDRYLQCADLTYELLTTIFGQ